MSENIMNPKVKRRVSGFLAAFIITSGFVLALIGFALVDYNTNIYGFGEHQEIFSWDKLDKNIYHASFLGNSIEIDLNANSKTLRYLKRYTILIPPKYRLIPQLLLFLSYFINP